MSKTRIAAVAMAALFLVSSAVLFGMSGGQYTENFEKTAALKAGGTFALENVNGEVRISTWKENKVEIKAVKTAKRDEADLKEVEIKVEESEGYVSVRAIWPKFPEHVNVRVDFDVRVPEGVRLRKVETVNGGLFLTGPYETASVETVNGKIEIRDVGGDLKVETVNGGIEVSGVDGSLEAETTNGSISIEGLAFKGGLKAETTNGSIELGLRDAGKIDADLKAETTNGHITIDFPVTIKGLKQSKHELETRLGNGGPQIKLETTNGSIHIKG